MTIVERALLALSQTKTATVFELLDPFAMQLGYEYANLKKTFIGGFADAHFSGRLETLIKTNRSVLEGKAPEIATVQAPVANTPNLPTNQREEDTITKLRNAIERQQNAFDVCKKDYEKVKEPTLITAKEHHRLAYLCQEIVIERLGEYNEWLRSIGGKNPVKNSRIEHETGTLSNDDYAIDTSTVLANLDEMITDWGKSLEASVKVLSRTFKSREDKSETLRFFEAFLKNITDESSEAYTLWSKLSNKREELRDKLVFGEMKTNFDEAFDEIERCFSEAQQYPDFNAGIFIDELLSSGVVLKYIKGLSSYLK